VSRLDKDSKLVHGRATRARTYARIRCTHRGLRSKAEAVLGGRNHSGNDLHSHGSGCACGSRRTLHKQCTTATGATGERPSGEGDGARGPPPPFNQPFPNSAILSPSQSHLVMRDTLCSYEAYGMGPKNTKRRKSVHATYRTCQCCIQHGKHQLLQLHAGASLCSCQAAVPATVPRQAPARTEVKAAHSALQHDSGMHSRRSCDFALDVMMLCLFKRHRVQAVCVVVGILIVGYNPHIHE
jgi:hypothetical protein